MIERTVPLGSQAEPLTSSYLTTPVDDDRSFFKAITHGYDALTEIPENNLAENLAFTPNQAYSRYLRIHKVMVGKSGAQQLLAIHDSLAQEEQPRYLSAAGSAIVEVALARNDLPAQKRLALLAAGKQCWSRAIATQLTRNAYGEEHVIEDSVPYRLAINLATAPLLEHLVLGYVPRDVTRSVFLDCLMITQRSLVQGNLLMKQGNVGAASDHAGFQYECNALLAYNRRFSGKRFAVPAFERADSGHYYSRQTHDLMIIDQDHGDIKSVTPVEIKSSAGANQRRRYAALLVRGKMHLSSPHKVLPQDTLEAITACFEGAPTRSARESADAVSEVLTGMIKDYKSGELLTDVVHSRNGTGFRDKQLVLKNYAGLAA